MSPSPKKKPTLFIVDGSNNVYRSYYAIRGLTNSAGLATNAVYGFVQMLRKLLKDHEPECIAVAFDEGQETARSAQFEDYKKDRKPMPDDLSVQIPLVYEALEGFRIPVIRAAEIPEVDIDDYVSLNWLEWYGGSLRLTTLGENICKQLSGRTR